MAVHRDSVDLEMTAVERKWCEAIVEEIYIFLYIFF